MPTIRNSPITQSHCKKYASACTSLKINLKLIFWPFSPTMIMNRFWSPWLKLTRASLSLVLPCAVLPPWPVLDAVRLAIMWTTAGFSLTLGVALHLPDLAWGPSSVNNHFFYVLASYVVHLMFLHGVLLFPLGPLFYYGLICSVPSVGARPRFLPSGSRSY